MTQPYGQQPPSGPPPYGQSQYGQSQYGQSQYGQPPGQPTYTPPAGPGTRFRPVAAVLGLIAAVLGVLAVTVLGWYRKFGSVGGGDTGRQTTFSKIHDALKQVQGAVDSNPQVGKYVHIGAISKPYFSWLGYVLLGAAVVLVLISTAPIGAAVSVMRALAVLLSLGGLGLSVWAIDLVNFDSAVSAQVSSDTPTTFGDWIKHTSFGAWAMGLAFLLCLIAALLPARRPAATRY